MNTWTTIKHSRPGASSGDDIGVAGKPAEISKTGDLVTDCTIDPTPGALNIAESLMLGEHRFA